MSGMRHNFALKLTSIVVATILFVILNAESSTPVEVEFPVEYRVSEPFMIIGTPPQRINATIQGPFTKFQSFDISQMKPVVVNLETYTDPGVVRHLVSVSDIEAPVGMKAIAYRPSEWDVKLDRRVERAIPVELSLPHRPAEGYEIVDVRIEPREVRVSGPSSQLMDLQWVQTRPVDISGRTEDLTLDVGLRSPNHPLRLLRRDVRVTVEIAEEIVQRIFRSVPVAVLEKDVEASVEPQTVTLMLKGPKLALDALVASELHAVVSVAEAVEKGLKQVEKSVELRSALPDRTQLVAPAPRVEVVLP